jgi:hypothetical protein
MRESGNVQSVITRSDNISFSFAKGGTFAANTVQQRNVLQLKAKSGGLDASDARRLKVLTDQDVNLKKLAEAMLHRISTQKNGDGRSGKR